jgi:hypothetical protein
MIVVTIDKRFAIGSISGGEPGLGQPNETAGITYRWNLPLDQFPGYATNTVAQNTLLRNTIANVMMAVGAAAQTTCQSVPLCAGGDYTDPHISLGGTSPSVGTDGGHLQVHGTYIDLSGVNDPDFAELSCLPLGTVFARPISGQTKGHLLVVITNSIGDDRR